MLAQVGLGQLCGERPRKGGGAPQSLVSMRAAFGWNRRAGRTNTDGKDGDGDDNTGDLLARAERQAEGKVAEETRAVQNAGVSHRARRQAQAFEEEPP